LGLQDFNSFFSGKIPPKPTDFWTGLMLFKQNNVFTFREPAGFALRCLSFSFSNAEVERAFSLMNAVKVKPRSRLNMMLLMGIMRIRMALCRTGKCCRDFKPTPQMFELFTKDMYAATSAESILGSLGSHRGEREEVLEVLSEEDFPPVLESKKKIKKIRNNTDRQEINTKNAEIKK
jgi:hypothetical protein